MKCHLFGVIIFVLVSSGSIEAAPPPLYQQVIEKQGSVSIRIPEKQLAHKSLEITTHQNNSYVNWTDEDRSNVFTSLQKAVAFWKKNKIADEYLIYGKQQSGNKTFTWEAIPCYNPNTIVGQIWQQFLILWKITFGGTTLSETQKQRNEYKASFEKFSFSLQKNIERTRDLVQDDAFCNPEIINKQLVLKGRSINILYNYAPIGFGGEKLHFLIVPKKHRSKFSELSEAEYLEATELSQKLMTHFFDARQIKDVYLFHKTGVNTGQSIPHWHMHLILISNKTQGIFGKLIVLKNILIGSSPMKGDKLKQRVQLLNSELKYLEE